MKQPMKAAVFSLTLVALAAGTGACRTKTVDERGGAVSLRIEKFSEADDWGEGWPLPFSSAGRTFAVTVHPSGGVFDGWVKFEAQPGIVTDLRCNPPACDVPCGTDAAISTSVRVPDAAVSLCVTVELAFGVTHILARDVGYAPASPATAACADGLDNDGDGFVDYGDDGGCAYANDDTETEGRFIVGASPDIFFENPRIENVQGYASASPLDDQAVTINLGTMVVTRISTEGLYVTDITPLRPGEGYNSLYAFNFNTPQNLRECDVLSLLDGIVGEFLGLTELSYPTWNVLPVCADGQDNDGDGLVDAGADPDCISLDDMSETTLPPETNSRARVPVPASSSECPIPEPQLLIPELIADGVRMEGFESGLVAVENAVVATLFTSCDLNGDGFVEYEGAEAECNDECSADPGCTELTQFYEYGQWTIDAGGEKMFVVSMDAYPDFDPRSSPGLRLSLLRGVLKQIEFIEPPWIIEIRCRDDLVAEGGEIKPIYQACVPPLPRGRQYDDN